MQSVESPCTKRAPAQQPCVKELPAQHPGRVLSAPTQLTYACCMLRQRTCVWPPLARSSWASRWLITRPTYCGYGCVWGVLGGGVG